MKPVSRFVIVIALVLLCGCAVAVSCVCVTPPLKYSYKKAQIMFTGRTVDVQIENDIGLIATFEVDDWFRGNLRGNVFVHSTTDCGFYFVQGERYLVQAYRETPGDILRVSLCGQTAPWNGGGEEKARLIRSRGWWWRLPLSYPGTYPVRMWYFRHF